jgi:hypothetical protein
MRAWGAALVLEFLVLVSLPWLVYMVVVVVRTARKAW